jgi:hypothetical protein
MEYRYLEAGELIPEGAQRRRIGDENAPWLPIRMLHAVPNDSVPTFIYRVEDKEPEAQVATKALRPGETILAYLKESSTPRTFSEIHSHLCEVLGDKDRAEKATRVSLQLLKEAGRLKASSVTYAWEGVHG